MERWNRCPVSFNWQHAELSLKTPSESALQTVFQGQAIWPLKIFWTKTSTSPSPHGLLSEIVETAVTQNIWMEPDSLF